MLSLAALLLATALPPPPDSDDRPRRPRQESSASARDDDDAPPAARPAGKRAEPDEDEEAEEEGRVQPDSAIVVTARRLDAARMQVDSGLGATVYSLTNDAIETRPGGEFGSLADVLAQAPGTTRSGNRLLVRGAPADQVRINDVVLPESLSDPAEQLSARLADTSRLITGTLPAQFGFAPTGVISVTTKNGLYEHGGQAELFAGSRGMIEPALEWAGSAAGTSLFASGSLERSRSEIADPADGLASERSHSVGGLGFADHVIDASNRLSLIVGGSAEWRHIGPGSVARGSERSAAAYVVGTFQHSEGAFSVQASAFAGASTDRARFAAASREGRRTFGTQVDASERVETGHLLRFGLLASRSSDRELEPDGDRFRGGRSAIALYAQDEWQVTPSVTLNPGARLEWLRGFSSRATLEPRASLVWKPAGGLTAHLGYARYASAPSTPLGPARRLGDEHDDYVDAGFEQRFGELTVAIDGYRRSARSYLAEHRTIGSAVPTDYAFGRARIEGVEFSATYADGPLGAWANLALASAKGKDLAGGESLFPPTLLAAADAQAVPLPGTRPATASAGLSWRTGKLSLSGDILAASGAVRSPAAERPDGSRRSPYALVGLAAVYHARIAGRSADLRVDLTNLTGRHYVTSDATSIEGGWTRFGEGRAITVGIEQGF